MKPRLRFDGMIFVPGSTPDQLQIRELIVPQAEAQALFEGFARAVRTGTGFQATLDAVGGEPPVTVSFCHVGTTAAYFALSHDVDGKPQHWHGLTALLSKLDPQEDRGAVARVRKFPCVRRLGDSAFDQPLKAPHPVAASFFADISSATCPPLHSIIRVLAAAFFSQFGIVDEQEIDDQASA
jgi:hypothetical protein